MCAEQAGPSWGCVAWHTAVSMKTCTFTHLHTAPAQTPNAPEHTHTHRLLHSPTHKQALHTHTYMRAHTYTNTRGRTNTHTCTHACPHLFPQRDQVNGVLDVAGIVHRQQLAHLYLRSLNDPVAQGTCARADVCGSVHGVQASGCVPLRL